MIVRAAHERRQAADVLAHVAAIPTGRVVTIDVLAATVGKTAHLIITRLNALSDDERQCLPWHRVVAKGGAIGRGPHRDSQFAKLMREGVMVSPAGIVQDMARVAVSSVQLASGGAEARSVSAGQQDLPAPAPLSRSRGMKSRPE